MGRLVVGWFGIASWLLRPVRLLVLQFSKFAFSFISPAPCSVVWSSRSGLMMNRRRSTNNSLSARALPASCSSSQLGSQISVVSALSTAAVPVDEIAAAVAQAMGSVLQGVLSSL